MEDAAARWLPEGSAGGTNARVEPPIAERPPDPSGEAFLPAPGTLVELSGAVSSGRSTVAIAWALRAQLEGETAAWVTRETVGLYGPDVAEVGLDLDALVFIRLPRRTDPKASVRAAELLLRSGGFGFVVIDFVEGAPSGPPAAWQGRLLGLAREHRSRVVLLSSSLDDADSLGPLVGLRLAPRRARIGEAYVLALSPLKVKLGGFARVAPFVGHAARAPAPSMGRSGGGASARSIHRPPPGL